MLTQALRAQRYIYFWSFNAIREFCAARTSSGLGSSW
jgi:hypothetical protein